ncbi:MAG: class I SAM-dependent methyltransferase [Myxococcota bacterium]|nr:class I SAM-dependent methyltransferase [Myxococcota bacterium]
MKEGNPFSLVAPFYERLMRAVDYDLWFAHYERAMRERCPQAHEVLDLCCGTGTMTRRLHSAGYDVVGLDLSPAMLAEARAASSPEIAFVEGDLLDFELGRRFDAAFAVFDGLNYVLEVEQLHRVFANVARHLRPGGAFVFDVNTEFAFRSGMFDEEAMDEEIPHWWQSRYDPSTRRVEVKMFFLVDEEPLHEIHVQRAHHPAELEAALEACAFERISCLDADSFGALRPDSDRHLWAARYRGEEGSA